MINKLQLENFKIHKSISVDFNYLTLLAGINSSGKSSIIQSLLLLRQSFVDGKIQSLKLSGSLCNIGFREDALCQYADGDDIISIKVNQSQWRFKFEDSTRGKNSIPLDLNSPENIDYSNRLFGNGFQYIGASRLGPQNSYLSDTELVDTYKQISIRNGQCENIAYYLYHYGKEQNYIVPEPMRHPNTSSSDLMAQISAWEGGISAGVRVVSNLEGQDYILRYSFDTSENSAPSVKYAGSREFLPTNVGFGLSYSLPIITALLTAEVGDIVIIENPEAHLHESGQMVLAQLICRAANYGIQVIVETHSSHILEGILISTKMFERDDIGISKEKVSLAFFEKDTDTQVSTVIQPKIVGDGKIDVVPNGFFDQSSKNLEYIMDF